MKLLEIRSHSDSRSGPASHHPPWVLVPERVARMLAADRYLLRKFCATRFGMQLHEDIVPIAEALDRKLDAGKDKEPSARVWEEAGQAKLF